jgi:hypothetical protein
MLDEGDAALTSAGEFLRAHLADAAASKIGQLSGWSRLRSPVRPNTSAPFRPSLVTARSSSCAAAAGGGGGEGGEALEPVWAGVHELGDAVVGLDLQAGGLAGRKVVEAGRGKRDHLDVEPCIVHRRDPAVSDLAQPIPHLPRRGAGPRILAGEGVEPAPRREDLVGDEVLLSADRLHLGALCPCW